MAEPIVEIRWSLQWEEGKEYTLSCLTVTEGDLCSWWDVVFSPEQAIETKNAHVKWHEDGMPE